MALVAKPSGAAIGEGLKSYYKGKIEEMEIQARDKQLNLLRLEAQRNELNAKGELCKNVESRNISLGCRSQDKLEEV